MPKLRHGVVIGYYEVGAGELVGIHRPDGCQWGQEAMKADNWQLFPNLDVAREAGHYICQTCFHGERQGA